MRNRKRKIRRKKVVEPNDIYGLRQWKRIHGEHGADFKRRKAKLDNFKKDYTYYYQRRLIKGLELKQ